MKQRLLTLADSSLCCITGGPGLKGYEETVTACCEGGADLIQLREKHVSTRDMIDLTERLLKICARTGTLLIVNDRADIALAAGAHGVHLGQSDLPIKWARKILGHERIIGASAHTLQEALRAQTEGADYVSCGPLWATPTKPDYVPVGLHLIDEYKKAAVRIPFFAVGGITLGNLDHVLTAGAQRMAVLRAIWNAPDPRAAAAEFKQKIKQSRKEQLVH